MHKNKISYDQLLISNNIEIRLNIFSKYEEQEIIEI